MFSGVPQTEQITGERDGKAPGLTTMVSRLKLAFSYTTTLDHFLLNIIVNFEKYEIWKTLKQNIGRGLRGLGPYYKRIPSKLAGWVLRYDIMVKDFQGFS